MIHVSYRFNLKSGAGFGFGESVAHVSPPKTTDDLDYLREIIRDAAQRDNPQIDRTVIITWTRMK